MTSIAESVFLELRANKVASHLDISPKSVGAFYRRTHLEGAINPLLKEDPKKVLEFLKRFYGRERNGEQPFLLHGEELGDFLFQLMFKIPWFRPKREYSQADLVEDARKTIDSFGLEGKFNILVSKDDIITQQYDILGSIKNSVYERLKITNMFNLDIPRSVNSVICAIVSDSIISCRPSWTVRGGHLQDICENARKCAGYIMAQDIEELRTRYPTNPFMTLFDGFYSKGLYPVGVSRKTSWFGWGSKALAVFHPPVDEVKTT